MIKAVVGTFLSALFALLVGVSVYSYKNLKTTTVTINLNKFKNLQGHINHLPEANEVKSINKPTITDELSLEEIELEKVVENSIRESSWEDLFVPLELEELKPSVSIAKAESSEVKDEKEVKTIRQPAVLPMKAEDRISFAQSAPERSLKEATKKVPSKVTEAKTNGLVFYDYSKSEKVAESPPTKSLGTIRAKAPAQVKDMIDFRQLSKAFEKPEKKIAQAKSDNSAKGKNLDFAPDSGWVNKKSKNGGFYRSEYSLSTYSVDLDKMTTQNLESFEVRFEDDIDDIYQSDIDGLINLQFNLNNSMGVRRGTIFSKSHYPLSTDFVFESKPVAMTIPVIKKDSFDSLLSRSGIKGLGGHILVELNDSTEDVEIDVATKYEQKVYLNKRFRVVDRGDSDFNYIMFIGVNPGNTVINFKTLDNQILSKIIHVKEEEIYYDPNFYIYEELDAFSIFEENLLGKKITALNIHAEEFEGFNNANYVEKEALNRASIKDAVYPIGTRKYHELKHLDESIILGRWDSQFVDLPSEDYMRFVLRQFDENQVGYKCMVQINLTKAAKALVYNGNSVKGMNVSSAILDKDGKFYDDLSLDSNRIFLLGEDQGVINVKIEYADNTVDYLQSYCSESTYLVEQL